MFRTPAALCSLLLGFSALRLGAHPIPDIPVRASFDENGACTIQVEVDPRCFQDDPEKAPYLLKEHLDKLDAAQQTRLKEEAQAFIRNMIAFFFEPLGRVVPEFTFEFTTQENQPLAKAGDPVVMTGTWRSTVPPGMEGYRIRAMENCKLAVNFINTLRGKPVERLAVLFPGEMSYLLDLAGKNASASAAPPEITTESRFSAGRSWGAWLLSAVLLAAVLSLLRLAQRKAWV